jgi:site-specific recombinase XerD
MLPEIERFHKWLRRKAPRSSTAVHYTSDLELFFAWTDKPPTEVRVTDVDAFIAHCQQQGHAIASVNRRLAALRSFYHFLALDADDAPPNPVFPKRHFIRPGRRLPHDVQDSDLERLFALVTSPRDRAMYLLMLRCGLRVGEIRNLSLGDLYLYSLHGALPRLWLHGKGGVERVVYLSPQARAALEAYLAVRPTCADDAVFLGRFGRRLSVTAIQRQLGRYCHKAGLHLTCHQFRHTFGRHMVEAGMPVTSLQRLLGHSRLRTTELYLHISDTQVQADYQAAMAQIAQRFPLQGGQ